MHNVSDNIINHLKRCYRLMSMTETPASRTIEYVWLRPDGLVRVGHATIGVDHEEYWAEVALPDPDRHSYPAFDTKEDVEFIITLGQPHTLVPNNQEDTMDNSKSFFDAEEEAAIVRAIRHDEVIAEMASERCHHFTQGGERMCDLCHREKQGKYLQQQLDDANDEYELLLEQDVPADDPRMKAIIEKMNAISLDMGELDHP